jgi:Conserved TM helix
MNQLLALILEPLKALYAQVSAFFPNVLAMLIIVLAGIFAARLIRAILLRTLRAIKFDAWSDRMGLTSMLRKGDLWSKPSAAVATVLFWLLIIVALLTGLSALHVRVIDDMISEVVTYLPRIVSAILILVIGYIVTGLVSRGLLISLVNSGFHFAKQFARAARLLLIMLIIAMALEQLQVAPGVVVAAFSIVFGGIVLALSISFGIAGVDLAKKMLEQQDKKHDPARDIQHM